jgi:hypothetical protein
MCYLSKTFKYFSFCATIFLAHEDVVVGIAIFHIKLSTPWLDSFICSSLILQESWSDHYNIILRSKEKSTPPWYVKVGGHLIESVSHGLRKEKWWGGVPKFHKKSTNVPKFQRTRNRSHLFIMEDSKTPLPFVDMKQPPLKMIFCLCFTNEKL